LQAVYFTALFLVLLSRAVFSLPWFTQNIDIRNSGCALYIGIYLPAWQLPLESLVSRFTAVQYFPLPHLVVCEVLFLQRRKKF